MVRRRILPGTRLQQRHAQARSLLARAAAPVLVVNHVVVPESLLARQLDAHADVVREVLAELAEDGSPESVRLCAELVGALATFEARAEAARLGRT
ncbi:hypothetical protein ASG63_16655 [Methylobacterium sp. Leaf94]|uniref:hypothetical protein n=1 Tax=Methylobacterium sp. Leaf94 TaxID=1736250 RepID=UPI0006FA49F9|nr:hypothetical protein [Methylobacterium sp. Leaf94]KQU31124.1 hypothetical protein ASG63_16655 [Methylobacterium sp. Leaf94]